MGLYAKLDVYGLRDAVSTRTTPTSRSATARTANGGGADAGCPGAGLGSSAEQHPDKAAQLTGSHPSRSGCRLRCTSTRSRSIPGHEPAEAHTLDLPCDDVFYAEA